MRAKVFCLIVVLLTATDRSSTRNIETESPKPPNVTAESQEIKYSPQQPINYRSDEFMNQHTENLRHIIATEQRKHEDQVQKQAKKEKAIVTVEEDRFPSLEELRIKCQHFSRLFGLNQYASSTAGSFVDSETIIIEQPSSTAVPERYEYQNQPVIEVTRRPVFIRNKPAFIQKNGAGFYITTSPLGGNEPSTTKRPFWLTSTHVPRVSYAQSQYSTKYTPSTTTPSTTTTTTTTTKPTTVAQNTTETPAATTSIKPKIKIKYTKFEPVILQKTILTDGRVMYHWHRSLPTTAVDLSVSAPIVPSTAFEYPPAELPVSQRNASPIDGNTIDSAGITSTTTTTTTTEKSSWLFVPFSSFFGGSHEEETTTVESTSAATTPITSSTKQPEISTTTPYSVSYPATEEIKPAQLKLVVPIHYDDIDANLAPPGQNPYRKPVSPTLEVIKTVGVPQNVPTYSLGYTGTGYGLTYANGMGYGQFYGPSYVNHQTYKNGPVKRDVVRFF